MKKLSKDKPRFSRIGSDKLLQKCSDGSIVVILELDADRRFENDVFTAHFSGLHLHGHGLRLVVVNRKGQPVRSDWQNRQKLCRMNDVDRLMVVQKNFDVLKRIAFQIRHFTLERTWTIISVVLVIPCLDKTVTFGPRQSYLSSQTILKLSNKNYQRIRNKNCYHYFKNL